MHGASRGLSFLPTFGSWVGRGARGATGEGMGRGAKMHSKAPGASSELRGPVLEISGGRGSFAARV
eukprot:6355807-Pyramimonas_sp.AAC.1